MTSPGSLNHLRQKFRFRDGYCARNCGPTGEDVEDFYAFVIASLE